MLDQSMPVTEPAVLKMQRLSRQLVKLSRPIQTAFGFAWPGLAVIFRLHVSMHIPHKFAPVPVNIGWNRERFWSHPEDGLRIRVFFIFVILTSADWGIFSISRSEPFHVTTCSIF